MSFPVKKLKYPCVRDRSAEIEPQDKTKRFDFTQHKKGMALNSNGVNLTKR